MPDRVPDGAFDRRSGGLGRLDRVHGAAASAPDRRRRLRVVVVVVAVVGVPSHGGLARAQQLPSNAELRVLYR